ncbi:MAG TPA: helix-turn-helix domain-containing protein [Thermomicrobiales bacterium]|nr:helix-turn-helix domain-containing protein [Thermomicrobiales bacterium]
MSDTGGGRSRREQRFTIEQLERMTGYPARTIRYYIARGLLQPAYGRGPTATYDRDHLRRLQYIELLKQERMSLDQIREHLAEMEPADIEVALRGQFSPSADLWRHLPIHEDLVVMIRDRQQGRRDPALDMAFDLIIEYARSVLEDLDRRVDHD